MSHWVGGKLELKCSLEVLRRALINVMPEWAEHIKVDAAGRIPIYTYQGVKMEGEGFNLVVPGVRNPNYSAAPGMRYSDLGFKQNEDGSWAVQVDRSGLAKYQNIEGTVKGEVARMKAKALAKLRGYRVLKDVSTDDETETIIEVDAAQAKSLLA